MSTRRHALAVAAYFCVLMCLLADTNQLPLDEANSALSAEPAGVLARQGAGQDVYSRVHDFVAALGQPVRREAYKRGTHIKSSLDGSGCVCGSCSRV